MESNDELRTGSEEKYDVEAVDSRGVGAGECAGERELSRFGRETFLLGKKEEFDGGVGK